MGKKILLVHRRAPGDTLVLTGLVRDIALSYPNGEFEIGVSTSAMDFWRNNPYIKHWSQSDIRKGVETFNISYGKGLKDQNSRTVHFMPYFHEVFNKKYGANVTVHQPYPDIHLSKEEDTPLIEGRYWIVLSGGKSDFTAKVWSTKHFRDLVPKLQSYGIPIVQCGGTDTGHWHPKLQNTTNLVGKTNLRDMARLVRYADGVICGVTMSMHLAAAMQTPCVCLGGGREAWWWEAYVRENKGLMCPEKLKVPHRFLHTIGKLDCCRVRGCWRNKVEKMNGDKSICYKTVQSENQVVPMCMEMITPDIVVNNVLSYYMDGTLPPIPGTKLAELHQKASNGK